MNGYGMVQVQNCLGSEVIAGECVIGLVFERHVKDSMQMSL